MIKLNKIQKITLSGLFLALTIIFTRFLSFQNIPLIPFVRVSLGPTLIIFSSLLFGPICGGLIGGLSDILGIVLVPNSLGYSINPLFTLIYTLLGVLPWCLYRVIKLITSQKVNLGVLIATFASLVIFVAFFLLFNDEITLFGRIYVFELYQKILIISLAVVLSSLTIVSIYFIERYFKKKYGENPTNPRPFSIALVCVIVEILLMLVANSVIKSFFFEVDFLFVFFAQSVVFFIEVIINSIFVTYLLLLSAKIIKYRGDLNDGR